MIKMNCINVLGWDILHIIFDYLSPRDVIFIATSINNNFREHVRSMVHIDNIRMNKRYDFKNDPPNRSILEFHIIRENFQDCGGLDYYIATCAQNNSYPDLFEKIINTSFTKHGFYKYINNQRIWLITKGSGYGGFDKMVLNINLPKLPTDIKYHDHPHDILKCIILKIGDKIFFRYNSEQIKQLNFIKRIKLDNNVIYYLIDLGALFSNLDNTRHLNFGGIRLGDLGQEQINFIIELNDIHPQHNIIQHLPIDTVLFVKYWRFSKSPIHQPITQRIKLWTVYNNMQTHLSENIIRLHVSWNGNFVDGLVTIKKMILTFDQKHILDKCKVTVHGDSVTKLITPKETSDDGYKYMINLNLKRIPSGARMLLSLKFIQSIEKFRMDTSFKIEKVFIYVDGKATW